MWPFTSRRIFSNRWWAVAFVIYVCYQAVEFIGAPPASSSQLASDNGATETDGSDTAVTNDQLRAVDDALNAL